MGGSERRRSARHLLGVTAEVHVGPETVVAVVHDVSAHGMGLIFPQGLGIAPGETVWILASSVASYAITATVKRVAGGFVGVELVEILTGDSLDRIEALPIADAADLATDSLEPAPRDGEDDGAG
ncbi:PilZ domain-containing protein [Myxococcota bacterium]|nr:PilZ domain-containing protein [Myxococcota bacterium]